MKARALAIALLLILGKAAIAAAQDEVPLLLRLSRDVGSAFGARIQGTFTLKATGPEDLVRVVFLIDGQPLAEDETAPFQIQFRTGNHEPGLHRLSARGIAADGRQYTSSELQREFLSGQESTRLTVIIVVALAVLIIGGRMLASRIANRGQRRVGEPAISGALGGTLCPNCGRPYALHLWGLNLLAKRLDRCPHCGKWRLVQRAPAEALQAAAEIFAEKGIESSAAIEVSEEERLRRQLDDSRFDDAP